MTNGTGLRDGWRKRPGLNVDAYELFYRGFERDYSYLYICMYCMYIKLRRVGGRRVCRWYIEQNKQDIF